jgi:hypothetical protein
LSSVFGHRKWLGLWGTMLSVMAYSILAKLMCIPEQLATQVVWGAVTLYGVFAGANAVSKKFNPYNDKPRDTFFGEGK